MNDDNYTILQQNVKLNRILITVSRGKNTNFCTNDRAFDIMAGVRKFLLGILTKGRTM